MTDNISARLHTHMPGQIARMGSALIMGVLVTAAMFWGLQNLINSAGLESVAATANPTLNIDTAKEKSWATASSNPVGKPGRTDQPSMTASESTDQLYQPSVSTSIQKPGYQPEVRLSNGFSLGVGEGDYLPIIKVQQLRPGTYRHIKTLRSNDGHCIIRNPVSRPGAVKDSTVMKGVCEINGKIG